MTSIFLRNVDRADLDKALFPLFGLLDFGVTLTREKDRERLALEIHTRESDGEEMFERAQSVLNTIHAVRAACENEALSVSVAVRREGWTFPLASTKRRFLNPKEIRLILLEVEDPLQSPDPAGGHVEQTIE